MIAEFIARFDARKDALRAKYLALLKEGFNPEQAITLCRL